jgi:hypothetical protein
MERIACRRLLGREANAWYDTKVVFGIPIFVKLPR